MLLKLIFGCQTIIWKKGISNCIEKRRRFGTRNRVGTYVGTRTYIFKDNELRIIHGSYIVKKKKKIVGTSLHYTKADCKMKL